MSGRKDEPLPRARNTTASHRATIWAAIQISSAVSTDTIFLVICALPIAAGVAVYSAATNPTTRLPALSLIAATLGRRAGLQISVLWHRPTRLECFRVLPAIATETKLLQAGVTEQL